MARRTFLFVWMLLALCRGDMEQQEKLKKLAELLEDEGDNLKAMGVALQKESGPLDDAIARQEELAAIKAAASGTSMLNMGGELLSSSVKGLRGSEKPELLQTLQAAQPLRDAVSLEAVDGSGEFDAASKEHQGSRTVGRSSSQVGTLSVEEKRLQDLLGLR
mmetsp:Transcript_94224/g.130868  ORF Transcript_94224/g.130868 Transcript_94224/m.130868 type:complete len:162 (+) Transcript_94224:84-569(+)|eukprot:symbB.v1.2.029527.t1/scaffold3233.1/size60571/3